MFYGILNNACLDLKPDCVRRDLNLYIYMS